jgi:NTP pyrophosphatase (non-canonical NTP hydrolase)
MTTLEKAIARYGKDMKLNVAIEELSELIKEICKNKRGRDNRKNIIEEMADCYIMLEQLAIIFGIKNYDINAFIDEKLARLEKRLEGRADDERI